MVRTSTYQFIGSGFDRMLLTGAIAILVWLPNPEPAYAAPKWAYEYFEACAEGSPNRPICVSFVDGFIRGAKELSKYSNSRPGYCLPENTSPEEVADAYYAFMDRYSHFRVLDAAGLLNMMLSDKWRCLSS